MSCRTALVRTTLLVLVIGLGGLESLLGAAPLGVRSSPGKIAQSQRAFGPALEILPQSLDCFLKKNETKVYFLKLINAGDATLQISRISTTYFGTTPSWLALQTTGPVTVPVNDTVSLWISVFGDPSLAGNDVCNPGKISFITNGLPPGDSVTCDVCPWVSAFSGPAYDTLVTSNISLMVSYSGNMGLAGGGKRNMNFAPPAECDTGTNSRGNADIYLYEAAPAIVVNPSLYTNMVFSSMYQVGGFYPVIGGPDTYDSQTVDYQKYFGGNLIAEQGGYLMSNTWWAPRQSDSNNFIIHLMKFWRYAQGDSLPSLAIGEVFDWDIPTDSGKANNVGGFDPSRGMLWQRGFNRLDGVTDCQDNSYRYGGASVIGMWLSTGGSTPPITVLPQGGFTAPVDSINSPAILGSNQLWKYTSLAGYSADPSIADQLSMLVFKGGPSGYSLPTNATLTVYTVLASVRTAASTAAALDSLKKAIDQGQRWAVKYVYPPWPTCCHGKRGDANSDGRVDSGDLSWIVCLLTSGECQPPCLIAADVNGVGILDSSDLALLVSYLTGGGALLPNCPAP